MIEDDGQPTQYNWPGAFVSIVGSITFLILVVMCVWGDDIIGAFKSSC